MIRGVAVVFGLVVIIALACAATVLVARTLDWWHKRLELRRLTKRTP